MYFRNQSWGFQSFVVLAGSCLWWKQKWWPAALNWDGLVDATTWLCPSPWWEVIVFWPVSSLNIFLHVSFAVFLPPAISLWGPWTWQLIWSTAVPPAFCLMLSPLLSPFLNQVCLHMVCYLSILRSPIYLPLSLLMRVKDGAWELRISMQTINPLSQRKSDIWATETMAAQGDGTKDWRQRLSTEFSYQFLIKWQKQR